MDVSLRRAEAAPPGGGGWRRTVKVVSLRTALHSALLTMAFAGAGHAEKPSTAAVAKGDLRAKIAYCETCHGAAGQGFRGYYPIPRLAGQQPEYFENQLRAFTERRRTNNIMFNVAHVLSTPMITALATHFHDLGPKPVAGASNELVAAGKKIYEEGVANTDVPPCASCHGPDAHGNGAFPRLAGQLHDYVFRKLTNWSAERGQDPKNTDTSAIMQPIAHSLTEPQIKAVAAYLNHLE
jgi:cytochrome c553